MASKHYDLDTNKGLGGEISSDLYIPSQKAVKGYVDDQIEGLADVAASGSYTDLLNVPQKSKVVFRVWS